MSHSPKVLLEHADYGVKQLFPDDADVLQALYQQCADFALLTNGVPFSPTAAREEFEDVPEGKTPEDVHVFGLFDASNVIAGAIVAVRHYPDAQTWWIGLMLLAPDKRGQGLGADFCRAFERWVFAQGDSQLSLCVIEANVSGLRFWQKMGFQLVRTTPPRQRGNKTHKLYVLSKLLNV